MRSPAAPWIALLAGPIVFLMNLQANFTAVPWVCATGNYWVLHAIHAFALALVLWAGLVAHRGWQASGGGVSSEGADIKSRDHFVGLLGVMSAALSVALIVAQWYPEFVLGACQ